MGVVFARVLAEDRRQLLERVERSEEAHRLTMIGAQEQIETLQQSAWNSEAKVRIAQAQEAVITQEKVQIQRLQQERAALEDRDRAERILLEKIAG